MAHNLLKQLLLVSLLGGIAQAQEATVALRAGWTPVAFPAVRLAGLNTSAAGLATYDSGAYTVGAATLAAVNEGAGGRRAFWLYSPAAANLTYRPEAEQASFVELRTGWNFISSATSVVVSPNVPTGTLIYEVADDGSTRPFDGRLQPARPYWAFASAPTRLTWGTVDSLQVVPPTATLRRYSTLQLEAFGAPGNQTVTSRVEWTSDSPSSLAVSSTGLATALYPGNYKVTARLDGKLATSVILVTDAGVPGPVTPTPSPSPALGPWTTQTSGTTQTLRAVNWGGPGRFVAVGDASTGRNSTDGITWNASTGLTVNMQSVASNGNGFFAGGATASRFTSPDGVTFTFAGSSTAPDSLLGAAFGNGFGMFVGREFGIPRSLTSGNALPFSAGYGGSSTPGGLMQGVAFGNPLGRAVAAGSGGALAWSDVTTTTPTWNASSSPAIGSLNGVAYGAGAFVAVGLVGTAVRSTDGGQTFTAVNLRSASDFWAVTFGNNEFVAVGNGGIVVRSPDGVTWTAETAGTAANLLGIAWSGTRYVAVGTGGTILTSP